MQPANLTTSLWPADAAAYLHDACATLAAFVQAHPAIAGLLLSSGSALLASLLQAHDVALPALQGAVKAAQRHQGSNPQQTAQVRTLPSHLLAYRQAGLHALAHPLGLCRLTGIRKACSAALLRQQWP